MDTIIITDLDCLEHKILGLAKHYKQNRDSHVIWNQLHVEATRHQQLWTS